MMNSRFLFPLLLASCSAWSLTATAAEVAGHKFAHKTTVNYEAGDPLLLPRPTSAAMQADFSLWLPKTVKKVRGLVVISRHGSGENFFAHQPLRQLAAELHLGLVGFIGDGIQRGMVPGTLENALSKLAEESAHPEIKNAPIFTFGMSNGAGFSCGYPCISPERVIGWIAYHPGSDLLFSRECDPSAVERAVARDPKSAWMSKQPPPLYSIPGLVVVGELDELAGLSKGTPSKPDGNTKLALERARREHDALMQLIVEPGAGHGHIEDKSWTIVLAFIKSVLPMRLATNYDATQGPAKLKRVSPIDGWLGKNWDIDRGGRQELVITAAKLFKGDRGVTSWLPNKAYAKQWQRFSRDGTL